MKTRAFSITVSFNCFLPTYTDIYNKDINPYLLCKIYSPDPGGSSLMSDDDHYWSTRVHGQIYDTRDLDTLLFRHPHSLSDQTHLFKTLPIYTKCRRDNGLFQDFFSVLNTKDDKKSCNISPWPWNITNFDEARDVNEVLLSGLTTMICIALTEYIFTF